MNKESKYLIQLMKPKSQQKDMKLQRLKNINRNGKKNLKLSKFCNRKNMKWQNDIQSNRKFKDKRLWLT